MATDSEINLKINVESTFAKGFEAESKKVISTLQQIASKGISTFDQLGSVVSTKTAAAFSALSGSVKNVGGVIKSNIDSAVSSFGKFGGSVISGTSQAFNTLGSSIQSNFKSLNLWKTGLDAVLSLGNQLISFLIGSVNASAAQQVTFGQLKASLEAVGVSYADVKDQLEETFKATEQLTIFSDSEQAGTLTNLVDSLGNYEAALKTLKPVLDFSAKRGIDLSTATELVSQAIGGNIDGLSRYVPELRGVSQETLNALSESEKFALILGLLQDKFGGASEEAVNTFDGALNQLGDSFLGIKESIGDFITNSPLFISTVKELSSLFLGWTERINETRESEEETNRISNEVIDTLEGIAKALVITGNIVKLFGNIFGAVFNAILIVTNAQLAAFSKLVAYILKGELAILKFAQALPEIPGIGKPIEIDPNTIRNLQSTIGTIEEFSNLSVEGIKDAFADLKGNIQGMADTIENIGDTSQVDEFFDGVRNGAEALADQAEETTKRTNNLDTSLKGLGQGQGGGKGDKPFLGDKEDIQQMESFVKSVEDQLAALVKQRETLGLSGDALIEYETELQLAEARNLGLGDTLDEVILKIAEFKKGIEQTKIDEKLAEDIKTLQESFLPESTKLQNTLNEQVKLVQDALDREIISTEQAQEIIANIRATKGKEITEALRKEEIQRLKDSGGFIDGIKAGFLEFADSVESNGELIADFFANTLSQMSQSFSDLFFNVLTGRFDDLKDLAKQTFEAILRAFLDLVSAIVTRQIVISIAGAFGIDTKGAKASDVLGLSKDALDIGKAIKGQFGGGSTAETTSPSGVTVVEGGKSTFVPGATIGPDGKIIPPKGGIGAGIGAGLLGISLGSAIGGIINSDLTGFQQGISFGVGAVGAVTGFIIGGPIGAAIGGFIGSLIVPIFTAIFKKTPRLDIDFDSVKTELGRRAADVAEFLDPDFFKDSIAQISVKRGGVGLGRGGDEGIKDVIQQKIQETVEAVQAIIFKLPSDIAKQLNEALLNTKVDIDTVVKGERLLEFDAKGKKIKQKFEAFINGELQAKFLFAIRDFFQGAFESLGVLPGKASEFLEAEFEKFKKAGSREERAKIGEELLASFNAFVDAFNIVSGNVNDAIGQTLQSIDSLSAELGFETVPSIGELTDKLGELLENAELDPETVQKYADLRNAIVQGISDIINSITGLIGKISQLNSTIVSLGGSAVNVIPFLDEAQAKLIDFYTTNVGNLSLGEQESFLDELLGIANAKLAEEQAAFQRAQEARQKAEEAQRDAVQKRIDNLNKEKDKINEVFQERIDALNEELRIAEEFASLAESIRQTLDSILFSPESVLTGVEQVSALQSNIATLQAQLASTTDPEKQLDIAGRLEDAFKTLFDTAGDAFGVNSPEFVAIFDQVTGGLESLAEFTEGRGRSVEEINAEIERLTAENEATLKSIDAKIEAAQERLANIGQSTADNTFHASQELTELFEFIRSEYIRILEERFDQLGEVSEYGFATETEGLGVIAGLTDESLTVLKGMGEEAGKQTGLLSDIAERLKAVAGFERGTGGFRDFGRGRLAILHGLEAVITTEDVEDMREALLQQIAGGKVAGLADRFAGEGEAPGLTQLRGLSRPFAVAGLVNDVHGDGGGTISEMNVKIDVNVNGGSQASLASLAGEIENVMVRSIRQGRVRKELQEAAARRIA